MSERKNQVVQVILEQQELVIRNQIKAERKNYNNVSLGNLIMKCNMILSKELPTIYAKKRVIFFSKKI